MATSTGCPARFMGTLVPNVLMPSSVIVAGLTAYVSGYTVEHNERAYIRGVQMGPGATALHLMRLSGRTWLLKPRMNAMIAPFVAV